MNEYEQVQLQPSRLRCPVSQEGSCSFALTEQRNTTQASGKAFDGLHQFQRGVKKRS
jgi:hypothetical protein